MRQSGLCLLVLVSVCSAFGKHPEYERLEGFAQHQKEARQYDKTRDAQELEHLEEQYKWELARLAAIAEHKKQKEIESPKEGGPEWREDQAEKLAYEKEIEAARRAHIGQRDSFDRNKYPELPTEMEELDLISSNRPRYDLKKRPAFGAPSKWTEKSSGSGSTRGGGSSGGSAFPPPPPFDDFSDDGFVPAPNLGGDFDSGDFPPPPPPPPPPFSDGGDFPDIPPPVPSDFGEGMPDAF